MTQQQINGGTQIRAGTVTTSQLATAAGITDAQLATSYVKADGTRAFTGEVAGIDPTSSTHLATKNYVDTVSQGLSNKSSARASTATETLTIASGSVTQITGTTVDGVTINIGEYILIPNAPASTGAAGGTTFSTQPGNGLYLCTANTTNLTVSRATALSGSNSPAGAYVFVEAGTVAGSGYVVTTPSSSAAFTYGTNNIAFTQFTGAGEITATTPLGKSGNTLSINSMATGTALIGNAGTPTITALSGDVTVGATGTTTIGAGAVTLSKIASAAYNTVPAASILAEWDANSNLSANAFITGFTTTATGATTTTLTISTATGTMVWTGSTTQTVKLPTTGIAAGTTYTIINQSSGNVTVQSSGANTIITLAGAASAPYSAADFTALVATPTTAANWNYSSFATGAGSGTVTSVSVVTANGFQGTVATATSTPAITIQTSVGSGVLASNGSNAIVAATTGQIVAGMVVRETPSGTVNGSNTAFTLAHTPVSGTEMLFQDGLLLVAGAGKDYTISGANITWITAPATGDALAATYWY